MMYQVVQPVKGFLRSSTRVFVDVEAVGQSCFAEWIVGIVFHSVFHRHSEKLLRYFQHPVTHRSWNAMIDYLFTIS
jgi:hypothetical protein